MKILVRCEALQITFLAVWLWRCISLILSKSKEFLSWSIRLGRNVYSLNNNVLLYHHLAKLFGLGVLEPFKLLLIKQSICAQFKASNLCRDAQFLTLFLLFWHIWVNHLCIIVDCNPISQKLYVWHFFLAVEQLLLMYVEYQIVASYIAHMPDRRWKILIFSFILSNLFHELVKTELLVENLGKHTSVFGVEE